MKISYRPTFDHFADNYLSTYYSGGVRTLQRAAGGPAMIMLGAIAAIILIGGRVENDWLRIPLTLIAIATVLYGLSYTVRPLFNVFLVWLRRKELFEGKKALTTLELKDEFLHVDQSGEKVKMPLSEIQSVQHRSVNTWILTHSDILIYIPREGLKTGNHDKFITALDKKLAPPEEDE